MKQVYTTLFDSHYLAKGIALCYSLERICHEYHLYIFAFDEKSEKILKKLNLRSVTIISLNELEDYFPILKKVKGYRGAGEYCWTCKGPSIQYLFDKYNVTDCAYLDSDLFFYQSPACILEGCDDADVVLTPHNFHEKYNLSDTNGYFCAQYLWFRNNQNGRNILNWWTDLCVDWCYGKHEPGKFGDQKYLERFSKEWPNVKSTTVLGCCAPWNISKYFVAYDSAQNISIQNKEISQSENIICYHFHFLRNIRFGLYNEFTFGPYDLDNDVINRIYLPYINLLKKITKEIYNIEPSIDPLGSSSVVSNILMQVLHYIKNIVRKNKYIWK